MFVGYILLKIFQFRAMGLASFEINGTFFQILFQLGIYIH